MKRRERPRIKIDLNTMDWILEGIATFGVIIIVGLVVMQIDNLPETLPWHYSLRGTPDGYGSKSILWYLSTIALILYVLLSILSNFPHTHNYLFPITAENAKRQYQNSMLMIRIIKTIIVWMFVYLTYATIQIGLGQMSGLGILSTPCMVVATLGTVFVFTFRSYRIG